MDLPEREGVTARGAPIKTKIKQAKGRDAYNRIMFYIGIPKQFEGKKLEIIPTSELRTDSIAIGEICKALGGKI